MWYSENHYYIKNYPRRVKLILRGGLHKRLQQEVTVNQVFTEAVEILGSVNQIKKNKKRETQA
jgi:hypothetical protein